MPFIISVIEEVLVNVQEYEPGPPLGKTLRLKESVSHGME